MWRLARLALGVLLGGAALPATADPIAAAQIAMMPTETGVKVTGMVIGLAAGTVDASLSIERKGPSGTAVTRQSRTVDVFPASRDDIGATAISTGPGAVLDALLVVTMNGTEIARAHSRLGPEAD